MSSKPFIVLTKVYNGNFFDLISMSVQCIGRSNGNIVQQAEAMRVGAFGARLGRESHHPARTLVNILQMFRIKILKQYIIGKTVATAWCPGGRMGQKAFLA